MRYTAQDLIDKKKRGERIAVLTGYDYATAIWEDAAGVDVILVGDSVGVNVLGYEHEREVTMEDMLHHLRAVSRAAKRAYVVVDLPHLSYESPEQALANASRMIDAGTDCVKLEGFREEIVKHLTIHGLDVWAHLGLNPQLHEKKALQAKTAEDAVWLVRNAIALEQAGAKSLVLEMVPEEVAKAVTEKLSIPTIGIGAGRYTDGQVLVVPDLLGVNPFEWRHAAKYEDFNARALEAMGRYVRDVRSGEFPGEDNVRHLKDEEREEFARRIAPSP